MALNGDGIVAGAFTEATSSPTPPGAAKATMALSTFDPRLRGTIEYRCRLCLRSMPRETVGPSHPGDSRFSVPFKLNYVLTCAACNMAGRDDFHEFPPSPVQICITAMANLTHLASIQGSSVRTFGRNSHIIPFVDQFWDDLTSSAPRADNSWAETVSSTLASNPSLFLPGVVEEKDVSYSLSISDLDHVNPYDAASFLPKPVNGIGSPRSASKIPRGTSRKRPSVPSTPAGPRIDWLATLEAFPKCAPPPGEFPTNPGPYRYVLAECDKNSSLSESYLNNPEAWHGPPGRPIPGHMYRVFVEDRIFLSTQETAPQLRVSADRLAVTGDKGYSGIRANHSVRYGRWYYEFTVKEMPGNAAVRAGWGTVQSVLQAPLGYDKFGYSWTSRKGTVFHESRGRHYWDGYTVGDVLGCYIDLPLDPIGVVLPNSLKQEALVKFKNHFYYEVREDVAKEIQALRPAKRSKIMFFKNGVCCGTAFTDIFAGRYYPAISLYKSATVSVNFGPKFDFPPENLDFLPMSDRVVNVAVEHSVADILHTVASDFPSSKKRKTKTNGLH